RWGSAGLREGFDQPELPRVLADCEYHRDRRGCSFGSERGRVISRRSNHSDLATNQLGHQSRQPVVVAFDPMVLHSYILPIHVTGFAETFVESRRVARVRIW